jgi:simple sugar transport system ATP-binding protein
MVFQHFSLFDALSVAENVALGMENPPMRDLSARIAQVSRDYGLPLDPGRTVRELSAGERDSGWRSRAACCRTPSSSSWTSPPRC